MKDGQLQFALAFSALALILVSFSILFNGGRLSFRTCTVWLIFCCVLLQASIWRLPRSAFYSGARECAEKLSVKLSSGTEPVEAENLLEAMKLDKASTLYLALPQLWDSGALLVENFYLRTRIKYVKDMQSDLPLNRNIVYVLSPFIPAVQQWDWKAFSDNVQLGRRRHLEMSLKGLDSLKSKDFPLFSLLAVDDEEQPLQKYHEFRIYRGILKENKKNEQLE